MAMYPLSIDCKYCGKSFFSKSHLIVHLYTETCMKNHLLFIASIVVNLSFLRVTLLFSEATMERGLSNVSIARKPFSLVWLRRWTLRWLLEKKDLPQYLQWRAGDFSSMFRFIMRMHFSDYVTFWKNEASHQCVRTRRRYKTICYHSLFQSVNSFIERERPRERLHHVELLLAGPVLRRRLLRIVNVVHRDNDAGVCSLRRLRIIFPVICFVYIDMHCIIYFVREFCHLSQLKCFSPWWTFSVCLVARLVRAPSSCAGPASGL